MLNKIAIVTINKPSLNSAKKLLSILSDFDVDIYSKEEYIVYEKLDDILPTIWKDYDAIIAIVAVGAIVRKVAPLLKDKAKDLAVVVINLELNRVLPLLGGHLRGANELAELLSKRLPKCINFVTTATDQTKTLAFEMLAKKRGWRIENLKALANISNRLLNKQEVKVATYRSVFESIEDKRYLKRIDFDEIDKNSVVIGYKDTRSLKLKPKLVLGIGCNKDTSKEIIKRAFLEFLKENSLEKEDICSLASFSAKSNEIGLLEFAKEFDLKIGFFDKEQINTLTKDFSTSASTKFFGIKGVAEPCAILGSTYHELVFGKKAYFKMVTIAGAI